MSGGWRFLTLLCLPIFSCLREATSELLIQQIRVSRKVKVLLHMKYYYSQGSKYVTGHSAKHDPCPGNKTKWFFPLSESFGCTRLVSVVSF